MLKNCLTCGKEFNAPQRDITRGNGKYCSRKCFGASPVVIRRKPKMTILICAFCDAEFSRRLSRVREDGSKSGLRFCSRVCKEKAQSLDGGLKEIQPDHYGTAKEEYRYREKAFSFYPKECTKCGYKEVVEVLQVHHKDRDRTNGDIANLEVLCPTCHMVEHFRTKSGFWASGVIENTGGLHPPVVGL